RAAGERFRVRVGAAEVEVRGTAFAVTAADDHLVAVRVEHGRVEVRPDAGAATMLSGGEAWGAELTMPGPTDAPAPAPAPGPGAPRGHHDATAAPAPVGAP